MTNEKPMLALPAPETNGAVPVVPEYLSFQQSYGAAQQEIEDPIVPLSHYLWILRCHKWKIMAFVMVCVASTVVLSSRLTPIYEATATIDIDRQAPAGFIGQDATRSAPNDADQFLATQINAIQSDSVLRPVSDRFKLLANVVTPLPVSRVQNAPVALTNLKVTVSSVCIDSTGQIATIAWSRASANATARSGTVTTSIDSRLMVVGTSLIWGEASYDYRPTIGWTITGVLTMSDKSLSRPRLGRSVTLNSANGCP